MALKNQTPNPFHAVFDAMSEDEKAEHLSGHLALVEAHIDHFEKRFNTRVQHEAESTWSDVTIHWARIGCYHARFGIDRRHTVKAQMDHLDHYLIKLLDQYELLQFGYPQSITDAEKS